MFKKIQLGMSALEWHRKAF